MVTPQQLAQMLKAGQEIDRMGQGYARGPDRGAMHWSQALAGALGMGVGGYMQGNAARQEGELKSDANTKLAEMLRTGNAEGAMANPFAAEEARRFQAQAPQRAFQQFKMAQAKQNAPLELELKRAQIEAARRKASGELAANEQPMSVREWQYFSSLPPDQQAQYLTMKRSQPFINLNDRMVQPDPTDPTRTRAEYGKGIAPERKIDGNRVIEMPGVPGASPGVPQQPQPQAMPPAAGAGRFAAPGLGQAGMGTAGAPRITELPISAEEERKNRGRQATKIRQGTTVVQDLGRALEMVPQMPDIAQQDGIIGANTRAVRSTIRGTPEYEIVKFKESALSNVGIDQLQQMRDNSPTGGALGQVPFQQQQRLEQMLGSIEIGQSIEILQQNMKRIQNIYTDIMFGDATERAALIREGRLTPEQNAEIERRYHQLPFDDMGRTVQPGAPQGGPAPASGGFSIRRLD